MLYNSPLFITLFFSGIIFITVGIITYQFPPKKINYLYGYRSKRAMSSQEIWNFAQKYAAKTMMKGSLFLFGCSFISFFLPLEESTEVGVSMFVLLITAFLLFYRTEQAIRSKFHI